MPQHPYFSRNRCEYAAGGCFVTLLTTNTRYSAAESRPIQQWPARIQAHLNVWQALAISELCEDHRCEVIVSGQRGRFARRRIASGAARKLFVPQAGENLRQNSFPERHNRKIQGNGAKSPPNTQIDHMPDSVLLFAESSDTKP